MQILNELNKEQREAAETINGPLLILAGAGSGKTKTITYRIANMIIGRNIPSTSILGVTFTNKAATEMRERVARIVPKERLAGVTLSTFHALGVSILKKEITRLGYRPSFSIYDSSDQMSIVREGLKNFKHSEKVSFDLKRIQSKISFLKNKGITEKEFADSPFFDSENSYDHATESIYHFYQEKLKFFNAIDFDDILFLTLKLFREHPEVAKRYSERFEYIMIDEYQDTNTLQFELITKLTLTHKNLCVVGDDDQAIYGFRGADVSNILGFEKKFPGAKIIKLMENYRSTKPILDLANVVIKKNLKRKEKEMRTRNSSTDLPLLLACGDTEHEAEIVMDEIVKLKSSGVKYSDMAILYRGNNQAQPFEEALKLRNIPYQVFGGQKFYDKKEVKDLIAYLQIIANPYNEIALRRVINVPTRGIGSTTLEKFITYADTHKTNLFTAFSKASDLAEKRAPLIANFVSFIRASKDVFKERGLGKGVDELVNSISYLKFIDDEYSDKKQAEYRKQDVLTFIQSAYRFENYHKEDASLEAFVERLLLLDSQDKKDEEEKGPTEMVSMMTLHSSKGLEFSEVFLVGVEEELLPHKRTITENEDISEELRLAYVGITRAKKNLVMTYCKERKLYGKIAPRQKSRFLLGAESKFKEIDRNSFGHLTKEESDQFKKDFFSNLMDKIK